jgi:hypothetical protein
MFVPYIGITDFMSYDQVKQMLAIFNQNLPVGQNRRLHVGVMMSYKTLNGLPTKWTKAFPAKESIAEIFGSTETLNCLHYADYTSTDVRNSLAKAIEFGGPGINALQLDMVWPDPEQVEEAVLGSQKNLEVILQVGKNAMSEENDDPIRVVERLHEYHGLVDCVLLDKSMGTGKGMDAVTLSAFARAIQDGFPELSIAVAGGLGPFSMNLAEPLVREFPTVSIDAQGRLRPSGNAIDPVDWGMAEGYLVKALGLWK